MSFQIPELLQQKINSVQYRAPMFNFVNNGVYYAGIDSYWINYMQCVVRPCIAYGTGTVDGVNNSLLSSGTGLAVINGAVRLIRGERYFFDGNDVSCKFLSDTWTKFSNFDIFLERSIRFMLLAGTAPIKIDIDGYGRAKLSTCRIDRSLLSTDESGEVAEAVFFISLLSSTKNEAGEADEFWLVEHRKFDEDGNPVLIYKVCHKSGIASSPTLPNPYVNGLSFSHCPNSVKRTLKRMGITTLNVEYDLPFSDNLGVWQLMRTASNSCVPDAFMGDPLLYGVTELLWALDVVFGGSITDVLLGRGKILVPKQYLSQITAQIKKVNPEMNITTAELDEYGDRDTFVYIQPSMFDKGKDVPTPVQFDIRSEAFKGMWQLYQKEIAVRVGFSPTSLFPHLVDGSLKTATEVNAEENLTRASVQSSHNLIVPVYEKAIKEILRLEGYSDDISLKLSDYIGNKIVRDQNMRENVAAGLTPKETAVQIINGLSASETQEYMDKLGAEADRKAELDNFGMSFFNDRNYYNESDNRQT